MLRELAAVSVKMLGRMLLDGDEQGLFCHKIRQDASGALALQGRSVRYSLIAWVGLFSVGGRALARGNTWRLAEAQLLRLLEQNDGSGLTLSDLGLLLWVAEYSDAIPREKLFAVIEQRWPGEERYIGTMEAALTFTGLAKSWRHHPESIRRELVPRLLRFLRAAYYDRSQLFAMDRHGWTSLRSRKRHLSVLGSFASQVYPLMALAFYLEHVENPEACRMLRECADRICEMQGPAGEWWWIYDARRGSVVSDYPVYSIHQDGMGPMALYAAQRILRGGNYMSAIEKSLGWMFRYRHPESNEGIMGSDMIWRAVIKDFPGDPADLPFGLSKPEMAGVRAAARPGLLSRNRQAVAPGYRILKEARPYCPGWILLAYSLACDHAGQAAQLQVAI